MAIMACFVNCVIGEYGSERGEFVCCCCSGF